MTTTKARTKELPEGAIAPWKPWWLYHFDTPDGHFEIMAQDWVTADGKDLGSTICVMKEVGEDKDNYSTIYEKASDYFEDDDAILAYVLETYGKQPIENR